MMKKFSFYSEWKSCANSQGKPLYMLRQSVLGLFALLISCSFHLRSNAEWVSHVIPMNPVSGTFGCMEDLNFQVFFDYNNEAEVSRTQGAARFYDDAIRNFRIASPDFGGFEPDYNVSVGAVVLDLGFKMTRVTIFGGDVEFDDFEEFGAVTIGATSRKDFSTGWIGQRFEFLDGFALQFTFVADHPTLPAMTEFNPIHSVFAIKPSIDSDTVAWLQGCITYIGDLEAVVDDSQGEDCYDSLLKLPTQVSASRGIYADKVEVSWNPVEGAESYAIYRTNCGQVPLPAGSTLVLGPGNHRFQPPDHEGWRIGTVSADQLSFIDTDISGQEICNLGPYLSWHYWVRAIRGGCLGQFPAIPQAEGYPLADSPHSLTATRGTFNDKVRLNWKVGRGTTGFGVFRGTSPDFASAESLVRTSSHFLVEGEDNATWSWEDLSADPGVEYHYWIEGYYRGGVASSLSLGLTEVALGYAGDLDPNLAPTDLALTNDRIAENNGVDTPIGDFIVSDPNEDDTHTFQIISVGGGARSSFKIENQRLVLNTSLDFESVSQYTVTIRVEDAGGLSFEKELVVYVDDVDEPSPAGDPPVIIKNLPSRLIGTLGGSITFEVVVRGTLPMQYFWYKNGNLIGKGDGPKLTLNPIKDHDEGKYNVRVINNAGELNSAQTNLFVLDTSNENAGNPDQSGPLIVTQPVGGEVALGDSFAFSVLVSGSVQGYQWMKDGQPIAGATLPFLHLPAVDASNLGTYQVIVSGTEGTTESASAILTVNDPDPPAGQVVYHPADTNQDGRIVIGEVTAYGSAWKRGDTWPTEPNPIPIGYLTRAGALWKGGEAYVKDASVAQPPLWWVNSASNSRTLSVYVPSMNQNVVQRDIHESVVRIDVQPNAANQVYAVAENLPEGFVPVRISHDGIFDQKARQVRWGPFMDQLPRSLSYEFAVGVGALSMNSIHGILSIDGWDIIIADSDDSSPTELNRPSLNIQIGEDGKLQIAVSGGLNGEYVVESTDSLLENKWSEIGWIPSNGGEWTTEASLGNSQTFFRIRNINDSLR